MARKSTKPKSKRKTKPAPPPTAAQIDSLDLLSRLSETVAVSGDEGAVRQIVREIAEIGFMIVGIDSDGLLKFEAVGGIDDRILLGKPVWVGADKLPGVIGMKPIHLIKGAERESVVKIDSLRIDIGATSRDAAARSVK